MISTASFYPPQHRNLNGYASLPTSNYSNRRLSSQYVRSTKTLLLDNNNSNMQVGYLNHTAMYTNRGRTNSKSHSTQDLPDSSRMSSTRSLLQQKQSIDLDSEATVILFREKSASDAVKTVQSACDLPLSVHCWGWLNPRPNGRFSSAECSISADRCKS